MKHTRRRLATTIAAAALSVGGLVATVSPASASTAVAHLMTCTKVLTTKPSNYVLSCADANARFQGVTWSSWTSTSASGSGVLVENDCTPYCAAGKFITHRARVTLGKVISVTNRGRLFSEAYFRYTVKGKVVTQAFGLAY
jgi:hypothetical protein